MMAHFAEYERPVAATQRAHSKTVEHASVRETPVAPRQEAREIDVGIAGAEALPGEIRISSQQDASIPDFRFLALLDREMRLDLDTPLLCERPSLGTDLQI